MRQVEAEESQSESGRLKIFLGYASGVGKSYRMFDEARRRRSRGQDVVIGGVQSAMPPDVLNLLKTIEVIPSKHADGTAVIDVERILARHPAVCVVDGLAYDNPPGSRNAFRWQDVEELLRAGIAVIGSINIQYIDELRERVEAITGKHVTQTVPVSFIKRADEIVVVDAPVEGSSGPETTITSRRGNSRNFASLRWCWRLRWWTSNWSRTCITMELNSASAPKSGS